MTLHRAKWSLAIIWLSGAGSVFLILVGQSLFDYYGERINDAWGWFLPTVMPTLALIIGVLVADHQSGRGAPEATKQASGPLVWLCVGLSVIYLLLVALSILIQPFLSQTAPLELMQRSNLWLGPTQGLTAAALAAFFRAQ